MTFRAAGTSLSGQALTDSVLLKINHTGRAWRGYQVHGDGRWEVGGVGGGGGGRWGGGGGTRSMATAGVCGVGVGGPEELRHQLHWVVSAAWSCLPRGGRGGGTSGYGGWGPL